MREYGVTYLFRGLAILVSFVLSLSAVTQADNSATGRVGFNVLPTQTLAVFGQGGSGGQSVTSTFFIPTPTAADLARGFIERPEESTLVATSNIPWAITVRTPDADMGRSDDGSYVRPISDLQVRAEGRPYLTMSGEDQVIAHGEPGRYEVGVDYLIRFDGNNYHAGDYRITLIYTISDE